MFQGFVYNQIWEDPAVDLEALELKPHHRLITIASGGCNVLSYLTADPARIVAVDLNPNHVALTNLKLQALQHLSGYDEFFRFFGVAKDKANRHVFDNFLAQKLDPDTRRYWERRVPLHGRRINMFARNLYRYGLLGRFIGVLHKVARLNGTRRSRPCSIPSWCAFSRACRFPFTDLGFRLHNTTSSWRRRPTETR
jgi:S-adenosylmethionine-diacylglycerol 3-amino-3-carboxypropyl transferase